MTKNKKVKIYSQTKSKKNLNNNKAIKFIKILKNQKCFLSEKYKIKEIGIFGSYVRNEQKRGSDLDILIELREPIGLKFFELQDFLSKTLKVKVDLVTIKGIKPILKARILREVLYL